MADVIYRLDLQTLESHEVMARLVESMRRLPGFVPREYDMNRRGQWREWDREHAIVDALTQRTQIFEIRGDDEASAAVATGKHGEPPQAIVRLAGEVDPEEVASTWADIDGELPLVRVALTTGELRRSFSELGIQGHPAEGELEAAALIGWPGKMPQSVERRLDSLPDGPIRRQRLGAVELLWICPAMDVEDEAHRTQLKALFAE
jgi:hypothetical protein